MQHCIVCGNPIEDNAPLQLCKPCQNASEMQIAEFQKRESEYRANYYYYQNTLMAEKNMYMLFSVDSEGCGDFDSCRFDLFINTLSGIPYIKLWHLSSPTFHPGNVSVSKPSPISFFTLHVWAARKSAETYNQYKGITEENWIDYIIDQK